MPLFRLTDVYLAYGTHVLLDKVSLTIAAGERWGLLGRNGAGKSTFLKLLKGTIQPDGGEIWRQPELRERRWRGRWAASRRERASVVRSWGLVCSGRMLATLRIRPCRDSESAMPRLVAPLRISDELVRHRTRGRE
jgi:ABC-type branched-subunit amino acid transport system ATPase component